MHAVNYTFSAYSVVFYHSVVTVHFENAVCCTVIVVKIGIA